MCGAHWDSSRTRGCSKNPIILDQLLRPSTRARSRIDIDIIIIITIIINRRARPVLQHRRSRHMTVSLWRYTYTQILSCTWYLYRLRLDVTVVPSDHERCICMKTRTSNNRRELIAPPRVLNTNRKWSVIVVRM